MKDLFFVFKMLGLTTLIIIAFQVKLGGKTLEDQFDSWIKTSILVDYIQEATDGGVVISKLGYQKADSGIHAVLNKLKRKKDQPKGFGIITRHTREESEEEDAKLHKPLPYTRVQSQEVK